MESVRIGARLVRFALFDKLGGRRFITLSVSIKPWADCSNLLLAVASRFATAMIRTLRCDVFVSTLPFLGRWALSLFFNLLALSDFPIFSIFRIQSFLGLKFQKALFRFGARSMHFWFVYSGYAVRVWRRLFVYL